MTNPEIQTFLDKHGYDKIDLKAVLIDMDGVLYDSMKITRMRGMKRFRL